MKPPTDIRAQSFELLTTCFCAGVDKKAPELRIPSIRGQLRWWHRVLHGSGAAEYEVFGGISGRRVVGGECDNAVASSFGFQLHPAPNNTPPEDAYTVPHKAPRRSFMEPAIPPGSRYTLSWLPKLHPEFRRRGADRIDAHTHSEALDRTLRAWLLLGTVGRRATRAMGSVWPLGFTPTVAEFQEAIGALKLPPDVWTSVLNAGTADPTETVDQLTRIAGDTIHGLRKDDVAGNPFGYAARERKASPLRFKVGRFADGLRLIAVWDNRNGRGGDKIDAVDALRAPGNGHQLADWLVAAGWTGAPTPLPGVAPAAGSDPVSELLAPRFEFASIARYQKQVGVWKEDGHHDLISRFIELTQAPEYGGLRQQTWYKELIE